MRQIREILRLRRQQALSVRETARALGVSVGVVSKTASRAQKAGITWAVAEGMTDVALEERMYGRPASPSDDRPRPELAAVASSTVISCETLARETDPTPADLTLALSAYDCAVAQAPPIPSSIYIVERERMERAWARYKGAT